MKRNFSVLSPRTRPFSSSASLPASSCPCCLCSFGEDRRQTASFSSKCPTIQCLGVPGAGAAYFSQERERSSSTFSARVEVQQKDDYCFSNPARSEAQRCLPAKSREDDRRVVPPSPVLDRHWGRSVQETGQKKKPGRTRLKGSWTCVLPASLAVTLEGQQRNFFAQRQTRRSSSISRRWSDAFRLLWKCSWLPIFLCNFLMVSGVRSVSSGVHTHRVRTGALFLREPSWRSSSPSWPSSPFPLCSVLLELPLSFPDTPDSSSLTDVPSFSSRSSSSPYVSPSSSRLSAPPQSLLSAPQPPQSPSLSSSFPCLWNLFRVRSPLTSRPVQKLSSDFSSLLMHSSASQLPSSRVKLPHSLCRTSAHPWPPSSPPQESPTFPVSPSLADPLSCIPSGSLKSWQTCRLPTQNNSAVLYSHYPFFSLGTLLLLFLVPPPGRLSPVARGSLAKNRQSSFCRAGTSQHGSSSPATCPASRLSSRASSCHSALVGHIPSPPPHPGGKGVQMSPLGSALLPSPLVCLQSGTEDRKFVPSSPASPHRGLAISFSSLLSPLWYKPLRVSSLTSHSGSVPSSLDLKSSSSSSSVTSTESSPEGASAHPSPRLSVGERRRRDRLLHWFKQYPYAPQHPAPPKPKSTTKIDLDPDKITPSTLPLPSRRLPSSLRWKTLAGTPVPSSVLNAAAAAAVSSAREAMRTLQAGGTMARRRKGKSKKIKKIALARAAVATAVAAQKAPGLAALRSAAEAAEKVLDPTSSSDHQAARGMSSGRGEGSASNPGTAGGEGGQNLGGESTPVGAAGTRRGVKKAGEDSFSASFLSMLYPAKDAVYPPDLAFFLMKQLSTARFNETVELHVQLNLGTGPRGKGGGRRGGSTVSGRIRGYVTLPHGRLGQLGAATRRARAQGEERREREGEEEDSVERDSTRTTEGVRAAEEGQDVVGPQETAEDDFEHGQTRRFAREDREACTDSGKREDEESVQEDKIEDSKETHAEKGKGSFGPGGTDNEQEEGRPGGDHGKPESGVVRGKKKGGIWRRRRIIAAFVHKHDEDRARQAGKRTTRTGERMHTLRCKFFFLRPRCYSSLCP